MNKQRLAVSTFFFINGFVYANWAARLPELQRFFGVSNKGLGTLLLILALGAILAMPVSGWLTSRWGTRFITIISGLGYCFMVPALSLSSSLTIIFPIAFILGCLGGSLDVSMNGQAVLVERRFSKPIMSSFHALFSIGMATGAGAGALFARQSVSLTQHLIIISTVGFISLMVASLSLIKDKPEIRSTSTGGSGFTLPNKAILPIGIIAFCGMIGEGAMADWSAIFVHTVLEKSEAISALGFGVFSTAMVIGRISGDYFTEKLGARRLLLIDSLLSIGGMGLVLLFPWIWTSLFGFFLLGLGLSTVVPIVYSKAGNVIDSNPSAGIAMATSIGYTGFFVGPPVIGFLADWAGLKVGFLFVLALFVLMFVLVRKI